MLPLDLHERKEGKVGGREGGGGGDNGWGWRGNVGGKGRLNEPNKYLRHAA